MWLLRYLFRLIKIGHNPLVYKFASHLEVFVIKRPLLWRFLSLVLSKGRLARSTHGSDERHLIIILLSLDGTLQLYAGDLHALRMVVAEKEVLTVLNFWGAPVVEPNLLWLECALDFGGLDWELLRSGRLEVEIHLHRRGLGLLLIIAWRECILILL